jgi:IS5 family transposase
MLLVDPGLVNLQQAAVMTPTSISGTWVNPPAGTNWISYDFTGANGCGAGSCSVGRHNDIDGVRQGSIDVPNQFTSITSFTLGLGFLTSGLNTLQFDIKTLPTHVGFVVTNGGNIFAAPPSTDGDGIPDARWTKRNNETFYGFKDHAKVDVKSKFIDTFVVTTASVHDSQATDDWLNENNEGQELYAAMLIKAKPKNKRKNTEKSKVEHIFGFTARSVNKLKTIGFVRGTGTIGLLNFTYNLFRYEQIIRLKTFSKTKGFYLVKIQKNQFLKPTVIYQEKYQ